MGKRSLNPSKVKELVNVKTFTTRIEAEVAKSFLSSQGIDTIVTADDEGGAYPFPMQPTIRGVQLLVNRINLKKAKALLDDTGS